jgi:hypothetical protein
MRRDVVQGENGVLSADLGIQKGDVYKAAVICRRMRRVADSVTTVSGCPLLLLLFPVAWTHPPRVACVARRDSLIICVLIATATRCVKEKRVVVRCDFDGGDRKIFCPKINSKER